MRLLLVAALLAPSVAFAQPKQRPAPTRPVTDHQQMATDDCARARALNKQCVLTIGPEIIDGRAVMPDGMIIDTWTTGKKTSLIRLRQEFIAEILKSANDI